MLAGRRSRALQGRADRGHRRRNGGGGLRGRGEGAPRSRGAARGLRRRGGAQAGRAGSHPLGQQHLHVRGPQLPPRALRRRGGGLRPGRPDRRGDLPHSPIEHAPIETTGAIAVPEANGRYTVYTNTQALYFTLDNTAIILQVPGNRLRFVGGTVGGGFGGKVDVIVEPLATLAAMKTGRPVRYFYNRSEEMQVSSTRSPWVIHINDGVMADGRLVARKVTSYADCGRLQPPDALRADQARRQRSRAVRHPQRLDRRLLRVHQPHADIGDARLRGDDGVIRGRGADGQASPRRAASTRGPCASGTPTTTATSSRIARWSRTRR